MDERERERESERKKKKNFRIIRKNFGIYMKQYKKTLLYMYN